MRSRALWLCAALVGLAHASRGEESDGLHASPSIHWTKGEHRVDLSASLRVRTEYWDALADAGDWFTGTRTRTRVQYGYAQRFILASELQDVRLHGMSSDGSGALASYRAANEARSRASSDGVRALYAEWRPSETGFVRMGRQDLKLGQEVMYPEPDWRYLKTARLGERLVGTVGWSHVERAYDGVAAGGQLRGVQLLGFGMQPTTGVLDAERGYRDLDDVRVAGLTATLRRGALLEASELGLFAVGYRDDRPTDRGGLSDEVEVTSFGGHWLGVYPVGRGKIDTLAWLAGQVGDYDDLDHRAGALALEAGYQFADAALKPWLRAGLNLSTGDGDPTDGDHDTFFNMLPTNHLYYGFADLLELPNLWNAFVQLRTTPHPTLGLNLFVHWLRLREHEDARYAGSGAFSEAAFGYPATPSGGRTHVGREYDVVATWTPHRTTTFEVGFAWLDGGAMFRARPDRDAQFFYASLELRY
jgi:hypothetical protein